MNETNDSKKKSSIKEIFRNSVRVLRLTFSVDKWLASGMFFIFIVLALLAFADSGVQALLINKLVVVADTGSWSSSLLTLFIIYIIVRLLPDLVNSTRDYINWILWLRAEQKYNLLVLGKKTELDIATHEDPAYNNLFNRINENGVWRVANFADRLFYILQNILEIIIATLILLSFSWWIFVIVAVALIPSLIVQLKYSASAYDIDVVTGEDKREYWNLQRHFNDIGDLIEVKLLGLSHKFIDKINKLLKIFRGNMEAPERDKFKYGTLASLSTQASVAIAVGWSISQVLAGQMQIGTLTFVFAAVQGMRNSLSGLFMNLSVQYKDSLYLSEFFTLLDLKPKVTSSKEACILSAKETPVVQFVNVSFRYPGGSEDILRNINLTLNAGEKLAIVGINGAGKTTLIKLLCRFYDPTEGRILVNGVDLREIDIQSWYAILGAIFQDYSRYNFLVKEAIAISLPSTDLDEASVEKAATSSEADTFIRDWDKGFNQRLGKKFSGGIEPSVGQWQKLALARTFYRDPRILILDEPTASIDAEAESKIFERLEKLPDDHTVILISHRFSTVRHANKIIVLENGTISEQGSHEELLEHNGTYARLFKLQAKGYE